MVPFLDKTRVGRLEDIRSNLLLSSAYYNNKDDGSNILPLYGEVLVVPKRAIEDDKRTPHVKPECVRSSGQDITGGLG